MYEDLKDTIFYCVPFVACIVLSAILGYMYYQDKNKRKVVFAIGILLSAFAFYNPLLQSFGEAPLFPQKSWLFVPMALAVLIAALSSLFKVKNFTKPFILFLCGTGAVLGVYFTQLDFGSLYLCLELSFMTIAVPILIFLFVKSRDYKELNFLLATLCFLFQGLVTDLGQSSDIPVMLSIFGAVFVGLMFFNARSVDSTSMASFVVLEKKLDEANQNLKQMQQKLLESERLATIGKLAGLVGHDLRNPLQGIAGAAYYLRTHKEIVENKASNEMLTNIETCVGRSNKIIKDLVEYSQELDLELVAADPRALTERSLAQLESPHNVQVVNQTFPEPMFQVDLNRVARVFVSIVKNAFDAMPDGGRLVITSVKEGANVVFRFEDTGIGMNPETLGKIWMPLFTTKPKGMGFGLAICKRIVEAHGGQIGAESSLGAGSTFTLFFPLKPKLPEKSANLL
jgi:signal transduction histidine kinase